MTGLELNKSLLNAIGWSFTVEQGPQGVSLGYGCGYFDFNNWNHLMPLVVEFTEGHRLDHSVLGFESVMWSKGVEYRSSQCINPQRATAECLLKVLENKAK